MKHGKTVLTIALLVIAFMMLKSCFDTKPDIQVSNKEKAYYKSHNIIKAVLKSPTSAEFPLYNQIEVVEFGRPGSYLYTVNAYVDADNSFGAHMRSEYTVQFSYNNEAWDVKTIYFDRELLYPKH